MDITTKNEFIVYSPLTTKSIDEFTQSTDDGERILLEGIASTTNKDLQGDIVSPEAIQKMSQQAKGLNIHGDHKYGLDNVIGAIKEVANTDDELKIKFLITKKHTPIIKDMLETGVNLGLSIGGFVHDYDHQTKTIKNIDLKEISLTAMPANYDTFGTVQSKGLIKSTCITGACYEIMKSLEVKNMAEEKPNEQQQNEQQNTDEQDNKSEPLTVEAATDLFNELMASKEQSIIDDITSNTETKIEGIVAEKVKEALSDNQPDAEQPAVEEPASTKDMSDDINALIKEEFDSLRKDLFKNISESKHEDSPAEKALDETNDTVDVEDKPAGYSLKSISERLASNDSKTALIKQIQQQQ